MTIYKKGWFDEIKPALDSIGDSVVHLMNPNYDMQQTLKALIAKDPSIGQKLANMGPDAVEKLYGKEMRKYAEAMTPDVQTLTDNAIRPEVLNTLQDPNNIKLLAGNSLKLDEAKNNRAVATINTSKAAVSGDVAAGEQAQALDQIEQSHRQAAARAVVDATRKRLGKTSIAEAFRTGQLTPTEKSAIFQDENATKELKTEIDTHFDQERLNLAQFDAQTGRMNAITARNRGEQERISGTPEGILMNAQMEISKNLALRTGGAVPVSAFMELQKNPQMQTQMESSPEPQQKGSPQWLMWKAAQETKDYRDGLSTQRKSKMVGDFMTKTSALFKIANDHKKTAEERANAVRNINVIGATMFGEFGEDRPVVEFDKGSGLLDYLKDSRNKQREPGVVIHGNSELTGMMSQADPSINVKMSSEDKQALDGVLSRWIAIPSAKQRGIELAKFPPNKQAIIKKLLTENDILF